MTARIRIVAIGLFYVLAVGGCSHAASDFVDDAAYEAKRRAEIETLVAQPSPATLTTAALLSYWPKDAAAQPLQFIERAEAMAPQRPELVWAQRSICQRLKCGEARTIETHLKKLDPDNGFAWIPDLERAEQAASDNAITEAITQIGASKRATFYWTSLQVIAFDGLTVAAPRQSVSTNAMYAFGIVSALVFPPLQPLTKPCRVDQFGLPGRREACQAMATLMERSDTVITQSLALSMQEHWWPEGCAERDSLRIKRRQLQYEMRMYEMQMSGQIRWSTNRDMSILMNAARHSEREEDVMLAVLKAHSIALAAPSNWKDKRESL
jgi:hypothetical protein